MIKLAVADITVTIPAGSMPFAEYAKHARVRKIDDNGRRISTDLYETLYNMPVLMLSGGFASEEYSRKYIDKHFSLPKGNYKRVVSFENVRHETRIQYDFKD
jgi:hypothetical protein